MTTHTQGHPAADPAVSRWIRQFHPAPQAPVRLLCLPHAGGSASAYYALSKALAPQVEVLAVQYPGRQDRRQEPLLDSIDALRAGLAEELAPWRDRPLALFGHSMGAVLAYEVARTLCGDAGAPPVHLFVSGRGGPEQQVELALDQMDDRAMVTALDDLGGTDMRFLDDEDVLRLVAPAIRSDYRAVRTYRHVPGPPLPCPITALVGDRDAMAPVGVVEPWGAHTSADFRMEVFPGGHFYLAENLGEVQRLVYDRLTGAHSVR
ncbi:thioesterase II family protein [Streptomyces sp. NPDC051310]|uniref:thioesterase II family protein n=1 Tax=Streptomyces sp. NPDC051310 TaxID=3365649 RepID=UPI0037A21749